MTVIGSLLYSFRHDESSRNSGYSLLGSNDTDAPTSLELVSLGLGQLLNRDLGRRAVCCAAKKSGSVGWRQLYKVPFGIKIIRITRNTAHAPEPRATVSAIQLVRCSFGEFYFYFVLFLFNSFGG